MKILFASSSSGSRGGGETFLVYLGRALTERGHEVSLWTSNHPRMDGTAARFAEFGAVQRAEYRNTYDRRGRSLSAHLDVRTAARAAQEWGKSGPEILHINKQNLEDGLDLLRAANRLSVPALCTIHITQSARFLGAERAWVRDFVSRRALRQFRGTLVAVIESRARELSSFIGDAQKVRGINNGAPLFNLSTRDELRAAIRRELALSDAQPLVIGVGRMVAQKRPLHFLERAREILNAVPAAQFVWIGDGPLTGEWDERVSALGLGDAVRRIGWQENVAPYFAGADLLLHVAEFEGLPLAILEAMSAQLPCAVSRHLRDDMPFLDGKNSLQAEQIDSIAAALHNSDALKSLGRNARRTVEEKFSFATMAEEYERLYLELLGGRR